MYQQGSGAELAMQPWQQRVDISIVAKELVGLYGKSNARGSVLYAPLLVASLWGCIRASERRERRIAYALTASGVILVLFAAVGAAVPPLRLSQPNRFAPTGYLLLTIPATIGLVHLLRRDSRCSGKRLLCLCARALAVVFFL